MIWEFLSRFVCINIHKIVLHFLIVPLFMLLPCPNALASICAPHSVTHSLEVPINGPGSCEFSFGQGSVLLEGHPSPQPLLGRVQSS
jgi:hypothetical protein